MQMEISLRVLFIQRLYGAGADAVPEHAGGVAALVQREVADPVVGHEGLAVA